MLSRFFFMAAVSLLSCDTREEPDAGPAPPANLTPAATKTGRDTVLGGYEGAQEIRLALEGEIDITSETGVFTIASAAEAEHVTIVGSCGITGKMTADGAFTIIPKTCSTTSNGCVYEFFINAGSGTLSGEQLKVSYSGVAKATCGTTVFNGTIAVEISGRSTASQS